VYESPSSPEEAEAIRLGREMSAAIRARAATMDHTLKTAGHLDDVDVARGDNAAFRWAAENGFTEEVEMLLLDTRVNPAACDNAAIKCAAGNGHLEVVKQLLHDMRVDPGAGGSVALEAAAVEGHSAIVKLLLADDRVDPIARDAAAI
jgi:hypothetical protein